MRICPCRVRRRRWRRGAHIRATALLASALLPAAAFLAACLLTAAAFPAPATAWANGGDGGNGFGTHDWVLVEADRLARAAGCGWLRLDLALPRTDDPDTRLHDFYHHVYDVWGDPYGNAPDRVAQLFARTVKLLRNGSRRAASATFGLLAHYYADICNPLHTDQTGLEDRIHSSYEDAVEVRTDTRGEHRSWVQPDGVKTRSSAAVAARSAAIRAHLFYGRLAHQYATHGFNNPVRSITRRCLSRAANDLADLLLSARRATL